MPVKLVGIKSHNSNHLVPRATFPHIFNGLFRFLDFLYVLLLVSLLLLLTKARSMERKWHQYPRIPFKTKTSLWHCLICKRNVLVHAFFSHCEIIAARLESMAHFKMYVILAKSNISWTDVVKNKVSRLFSQIDGARLVDQSGFRFWRSVTQCWRWI